MKYSPVFTIEIEHDYFSVSKPQLLRLVPTSGTQKILQGAGLTAKFIQNKLYVLAKHLDDASPYLALSNDFSLQFLLEVSGVNFSKITNYSNEDPYNTKLYFSNANSIVDGNDKSVENLLYLNEKLPLFNVANSYKYNDIVRNPANTAFECLVKVDANTGNLNDANQFRELEKVSYATSSTSLVFTGLEKNIQLEVPASAIDIKYFQYNSATSQFDLQVKHSIVGTLENPTNQLLNETTLSFYDENKRLLSEGIYRVVINGQERFFYFRAENDWQPYIGLVNIHNNALSSSVAYRFLEEDGSFYTIAPENTEVDTRNYKIRFAPSQFLLKYVCKTNKVTDITDDDGNIEFDNIGSNTFRSKLPVRMNEKSIDTISVAYDGSDVLKKMKTPGHANLSILKDENKYIVSETFLNL